MEPVVVDNPVEFLRDSGLLFHINRTILHPLGLSLSLINIEEAEENVLDIVLHSTNDPHGFRFPETTMQAGQANFDTFMAKIKPKVLRRAKALGYITQPLTDG